MQRRPLLLALAAAPLAARAQAPEGWQLQGQGRMRFFGLSIYDIRLWAPNRPGPQWWAQPLALELEYARTLKGREIAKRSLEEMRRQQPIGEEQGRRWLAEMEAAFPDVKAGDRLSGRHEPEQGAAFFFNGAPRRRIADPLFSRLFFGIWLAPQTSEPALRAQLLGTES
jgi:hypothetical protein